MFRIPFERPIIRRVLKTWCEMQLWLPCIDSYRPDLIIVYRWSRAERRRLAKNDRSLLFHIEIGEARDCTGGCLSQLYHNGVRLRSFQLEGLL